MASIKREQLLGRTVPQHAFHAAFDKGPNPSRTESLALKTEIGDLIERIDHSQPRIEFETVDDPDRIPQPDMLGAQVAMARDDLAMAKAGDDETAAPIQKPALRTVDTLHQAGGHAKTTIEQYASVIGKAALPIGKVDRCREQDRRRRAVKLRQRRDQTAKLEDVDTLLGDETVEHVAFVETLHDDEPIDRDAGSTDREPFAGVHQG